MEKREKETAGLKKGKKDRVNGKTGKKQKREIFGGSQKSTPEQKKNGWLGRLWRSQRG
jgi:hypothetical protein